jgi:glucose-6-phosphate 1-epimerase/putative transcriptional regulator
MLTGLFFAQPEIGGLIVRLPLEVELQRNFAHSITGKSMRETLQVDDTAKWYEEAQTLIAQSMLEIAQLAGDDGQIDPAALSAEKADLLTLYLDNQESWQEVGLILERDTDLGTASTLVLNRPMAFQLTEHLARLVLHGSAMEATPTHTRKPDIHKFLAAFEMECAVYIGGLDQQEEPAEIIHGIKSLKGAVEIAPGTGIYRGGLAAAVDGVIKGIYQPLEFRFFVGKHLFEDNYLDISMLLGKYQPVACSRALALKQCISLPKPLWHEVLEWVGGTLAQISDLELSKRDDLKFKIVDEDFDSGLDELNRFEDDDEEEDDDEDYYSK